MSRTAYVDADILVWLGCLAATEEWDGETFTNLKEAERVFDSTLAKWLAPLDIADVILCLSDRENFRRELFPSYKANRKDTSRPPGIDPLKDIIRKRPNALTLPKLEADDVIGVHTSYKWDSTVAVSTDKDFNTLPCYLSNPSKKRLPKRITEFDANVYWFRQTLIGDPTDNISGCPKIGTKRAEVVVPAFGMKPEHVWPRVVGAFQKAGLTEDDALLNARLTRILRSNDYGAEGPILWTPPGRLSSREASNPSVPAGLQPSS